MDEQEKSESRWEEAEQLGPYQLQEQVPQDEYSQGELYRATHETSGAPALVLKPAAKDEPRRFRWHPGWGLAGAAAVGALLFALLRLACVSQPPSGSAPVANAPPAPTSHDGGSVPTTTGMPDPVNDGWLADSTSQGELVLARPLPREPFKGQKRPPCTRYTEVELIGACWVPHKLKAPCPENLYEHQGECYLPMFSVKPPPQSLGQ
jgi:hypothetical protein